VALLREELVDAPPLAESGTRAARLLAFDFSASLRVKDPLLWDWLASRPEWESTEERLLWRMLENAAHPASAPAAPFESEGSSDQVPSPRLEQALRRAEELAGSENHSRCRTLGWIMNRMGLPQRSIPLLRAAVRTAGDEESRERATFTLFESLLDVGDWAGAEALFPTASRRLNLHELPEWHSRLALLAAADGYPADALRLWIRTAKASPNTVRGLDRLGALGLRDDLIAFYRAMQKDLPTSRAPARALEVLEAN
jgi:hypothetical protein